MTPRQRRSSHFSRMPNKQVRTPADTCAHPRGVLSAGALTALLFCTAPVAFAEEVVIPFKVWRLLLPRDGEVIAFPPAPGQAGYDRWPGNANKGDFERHEMVEIAFGWELRAQAKHRQKEGPMHYEICETKTHGKEGIDVTTCRKGSRARGFTDRGDHVSVAGSFRAHKQVKVHNDYFDGRFFAKLTLGTSGGRLTMELSDVSIDWNESGLYKVAYGFTFSAIKGVIEKVLQPLEDQGLPGDFQSGFAKLHQGYLSARASSGVVSRLADHTELGVRGTAIVLRFDTNAPDSPGQYFPPAPD